MPSIFTRKKSSTPPHAPSEAPPSPRPRPSTDSAEAQRTRSAQSSPDKKSRSSFVRERDQREKEKRPRSPRASSSFAFRRRSSDSHPLNLPPEELRRLSALRTANMASPREEISEPMQESTPAPQQAPGAFPQANGNGANGDHTEESGPAPPPHKSASNSPPSNSPPQSPVVDAAQCKEAGNKFFKAQQYDKAIEEYTKGGSFQAG
jgi:DnaJ family protein C protein 7